jgi:hypothetical protein
MGCLCLHDSQNDVTRIAEKIICAFTCTPGGGVSMNDNATGRKKPLFANLVVGPTSRIKLWQDKFATSIGFRRH